MFKKYNSIENSYRTPFLEQIKIRGFWEQEYVVQEKAHGANLSYWTTDGINFTAAKRTSNINQGEKFYGYELILNTLQVKFEHIWKAVKKEHPSLTQLTIFGELIGGHYPHADVKKNNTVSKVQKGVYYSPENLFFAFDILINGTTYLDVSEANKYFEQSDLLHAKTLFQGSIEDCLAYPNEFDSTIPATLGLPPISPNICEGVIIKPIKTSFFIKGSRVILKNKNEKWSENEKRHRPIKKEAPLSEKVLELKAAILDYATDNRLSNVLSKTGPVTQKDIGKVLGMFNKDIVEDFSKDYQEAIVDLEKTEFKLIKKSIGKTTALMVRKRVMHEAVFCE